MTEFTSKNKGIQFKINKSIHMIPSKDFPLASKNTKDLMFFHFENTDKVKDPKIIELFDSFEYRIGKCFDNARLLKEYLEGAGETNWDYYSGWLFPIKGYPVFHAWLVKDKYILDYLNYTISEEIADKLKDAKSDKEIRSIIINEQVALNELPPSEVKSCGKAHKEYLYIGTKDTYENSEKIFKSLSENHISYAKKGMNMKGLSSVQEELEEIRRKE